MSNAQQPQQMLQQIRNLLVSNTKTNRDDTKSISDDQINKYLAESYKLIQEDKVSKTEKKHLDSKVTEASILLSDSSIMIKNYVKDKIQSEIFSGKKLKNNSQQFYKLMEQRQHLQKKRLQQKLEEQNRINNMIESARKFKKYQKVSEVPLPQLQSLIQRQKIDFDRMIKQQHRVKSNNNQVQFSGLKVKNDVFITSTKRKKKKVTTQQNQQKVDSQSYIIQVQGTEEDQQHLFQKIAEQYQGRMQETLKRNMNFVKAFVGFIHSQIRKIQNQKVIQSHQTENIHFSASQTKKKRFKFPETLMKQKREPERVGLSQLSKTFKFRGFFQQKQQVQEKIRVQPIKKVVSKRNGDSDKFHMKQCLIEGNKFYYGDEQNDDKELKKSDMKSFIIDIMPLQKITIVKQEGFLFQKKGTDIDVVTVKGKERSFTYQLNLGQGMQLTQQLNKIIIKKYHKMSCLLNAYNNKNMEKFIEGQHPILDFSEKYVRPDQQHPVKNHKNSFIKMIINLFPKRKTTNIVNLQKCNLSFNQINTILKQCDEHFTNISEINMSKTKIDKETLKNILNLVKKCPISSTIDLNLSFCQLTDDILQANFALLENLSPKIGNLDLSNNFITANSLKMLRNILSSKICEIKVLNISGCPIQQVADLTELIRNSSKIQQIIANDCKITIKASNQMENLMLCTQQRPHLKKLQLKKNNYQGTFKWIEEIGQNLQLKLDLSLKLISNKNLQSKYLRATLINNLK